MDSLPVLITEKPQQDDCFLKIEPTNKLSVELVLNDYYPQSIAGGWSQTTTQLCGKPHQTGGDREDNLNENDADRL